jgi:phage-related protein
MQILFYSDRVRREIEAWPDGLYADFLYRISLVEQAGRVLAAPWSKALGEGLFEFRCRSQDGIARAFYCTVKGDKLIVLHGYIKKTQKAPPQELDVARRRLKEVKAHG